MVYVDETHQVRTEARHLVGNNLLGLLERSIAHPRADDLTFTEILDPMPHTYSLSLHVVFGNAERVSWHSGDKEAPHRWRTMAECQYGSVPGQAGLFMTVSIADGWPKHCQRTPS